MRVRAATPGDAPAWDRFVNAHPEATLFHLAGWRDTVARCFRHRDHSLIAEDAGGLVGVLPLLRVKSMLFGDSLSSTPFAVYGGPLAADGAASDALLEGAKELAQRLKVGSLELRNTEPLNQDWPRKDLYFTFRKSISADHEENLKAIPRKQRAMVRKGIKAGLKGENTEQVDAFFAIYSESVRNLGTPVFPRRYFRLLFETFREQAEIRLVRNIDGKPIASVMSFYFRDQVLPYYGGSIAEARALKGNDFMYWDLMQHAVERGARVFDYGRSKSGTGSFSFKKNWGFTPEPLNYEYFLVRDQAMPEVNPNNPKYRTFIKAWKRLPLPVANLLGPRLSPYLG